MVAFDKSGQGYWIFEEQKLSNNEEVINYPEGGKITKAMHDKIFIPTYTRFLSVQGNETRKKYLAGNIVNVWWDYEDKTVNVKFNNGDWWHFTAKGEWY